MNRRRKHRSPEAIAAANAAWQEANERSIQRRKANGTFPGEGELDEQGNTRCVGCGAVVLVVDEYAEWKARMERLYPGEPIETLEETVADCKTLCDECGSAC